MGDRCGTILIGYDETKSAKAVRVAVRLGDHWRNARASLGKGPPSQSRHSVKWARG